MALLCGTNCEDDGATLLDNLQSLLREPDTSLSNLSTSHSKETHDVPESFHVAQQVQYSTVHVGDMEVFSVARVSGSIARQVLHGVSCVACKEYSDTEQSLTCPSEKLVETDGAAVILMESMMAEVAHLNSVEQHITAAIKHNTDFEWIRCTGCSLHRQQIIGGIVRGFTRIYIPWWCR
jgi:hypothetical protein